MKWQPIETAPTDGTRVDLWVPDAAFKCGGQRFTDMAYREGDVSEPNDWDGEMLMLSDCDYGVDDVTHWMLVTPPEKPTT